MVPAPMPLPPTVTRASQVGLMREFPPNPFVSDRITRQKTKKQSSHQAIKQSSNQANKQTTRKQANKKERFREFDVLETPAKLLRANLTTREQEHRENPGSSNQSRQDQSTHGRTGACERPAPVALQGPLGRTRSEQAPAPLLQAPKSTGHARHGYEPCAPSGRGAEREELPPSASGGHLAGGSVRSRGSRRRRVPPARATNSRALER